MNKWSIKISLEYSSKETLIKEFERVVAELKNRDYPRCCNGSSELYYQIQGPPARTLSDNEIESIREIIAGWRK